MSDVEPDERVDRAARASSRSSAWRNQRMASSGANAPRARFTGSIGRSRPPWPRRLAWWPRASGGPARRCGRPGSSPHSPLERSPMRRWSAGPAARRQAVVQRVLEQAVRERERPAGVRPLRRRSGPPSPLRGASSTSSSHCATTWASSRGSKSRPMTDAIVRMCWASRPAAAPVDPRPRARSRAARSRGRRSPCHPASILLDARRRSRRDDGAPPR